MIFSGISRQSFTISFTVVLALLDVCQAQSFAERCQAFRPNIPDLQVNVLEFISKGTNVTFPNVVSM